MTPTDAPHVEAVAINSLVMMFTASLALGTGVGFGLVPMFSSSRGNGNESLKDTTRAASGGARDRQLRNLLVIGEFGLSLALLAGAGLMTKALTHLHYVDAGCNPDHLLTLKIPLQGPQYHETEKRVRFFHDLVARLETLPGVKSASLSRGVPIRGWTGWNFVTADKPHPVAGEVPHANCVVVGPHYFTAMQTPIAQGRAFSDFAVRGRTEWPSVGWEAVAETCWIS